MIHGPPQAFQHAPLVETLHALWAFLKAVLYSDGRGGRALGAAVGRRIRARANGYTSQHVGLSWTEMVSALPPPRREGPRTRSQVSAQSETAQERLDARITRARPCPRRAHNSRPQVCMTPRTRRFLVDYATSTPMSPNRLLWHKWRKQTSSPSTQGKMQSGPVSATFGERLHLSHQIRPRARLAFGLTTSRTWWGRGSRPTDNASSQPWTPLSVMPSAGGSRQRRRWSCVPLA